MASVNQQNMLLLLGTILLYTTLSSLVQCSSTTEQPQELNTSPSPSPSKSSSVRSGGSAFTLRPLNIGTSNSEGGTVRSQVTDEAIEQTLNDKRYLQRLLKCAASEGPCDPLGRRIKSLAPLVLRGNCPMCTASEHKQIKKVLSYVQVNFPKEWNRILQTYAG